MKEVVPASVQGSITSVIVHGKVSTEPFYFSTKHPQESFTGSKV